MILNWLIIGSIILFFSLLTAWSLKQAHPRKKKFYDPKNITVTFNGIQLKGYADDTFIRHEKKSTETNIVKGSGIKKV